MQFRRRGGRAGYPRLPGAGVHRYFEDPAGARSPLTFSSRAFRRYSMKRYAVPLQRRSRTAARRKGNGSNPETWKIVGTYRAVSRPQTQDLLTAIRIHLPLPFGDRPKTG